MAERDSCLEAFAPGEHRETTNAHIGTPAALHAPDAAETARPALRNAAAGGRRGGIEQHRRDGFQLPLAGIGQTAAPPTETQSGKAAEAPPRPAPPGRAAMDGWSDGQWIAAFPAIREIHRDGCPYGSRGRKAGTISRGALAHAHPYEYGDPKGGAICFNAGTPEEGYAALMLHEIAHFHEPRRGNRSHHAAFYAELERLVGAWFGEPWTIRRKPWTPIVTRAGRAEDEARDRERLAKRRRTLREDEAKHREIMRELRERNAREGLALVARKGADGGAKGRTGPLCPHP